MGGRLDAQQAAPSSKTARGSPALACMEKSPDAQLAQDGSGKRPLHDVNPASVSLQKSSGTSQPQAASEPTALAALAALAASRAASKHQDNAEPTCLVTDSPSRKKAAGPKGSKCKEQSVKCACYLDFMSFSGADNGSEVSHIDCTFQLPNSGRWWIRAFSEHAITSCC